MPAFEVQGHRGARGLRPENTLPGFELALDLGVTSVETDLHLSADDVPVLFHDPRITPQLCSARPGLPIPEPAAEPLVRQLRLDEIRGYSVDRAGGDLAPSPLAQRFAEERGLDPLGIPTLAELFAFTAYYAGEPGRAAAKSPLQQQRAREFHFDLELKRVPFYPETSGVALGKAVLEVVRQAGVLDRTVVRSFDHRAVRKMRELEPSLTTGVLVYHTAPADPVRVAEDAGAALYCPDFHFLDEALVRRLHEGGKRVLAWTVNRPEQWQRLLAWGVDGITTDYPDRLLAWLAERGVAVL